MSTIRGEVHLAQVIEKVEGNDPEQTQFFRQLLRHVMVDKLDLDQALLQMKVPRTVGNRRKWVIAERKFSARLGEQHAALTAVLLALRQFLIERERACRPKNTED